MAVEGSSTSRIRFNYNERPLAEYNDRDFADKAREAIRLLRNLHPGSFDSISDTTIRGIPDRIEWFCVRLEAFEMAFGSHGLDYDLLNKFLQENKETFYQLMTGKEVVTWQPFGDEKTFRERLALFETAFKTQDLSVEELTRVLGMATEVADGVLRASNKERPISVAPAMMIIAPTPEDPVRKVRRFINPDWVNWFVRANPDAGLTDVKEYALNTFKSTEHSGGMFPDDANVFIEDGEQGTIEIVVQRTTVTYL